MPRTVTLILLGADGYVLGALPPFEVGLPWWPEVAEPVEIARERFGVRAQVLRMLDVDRPAMPGGSVRYLAEVTAPGPDGVLEPVSVALPDDPRRAPYARPGGPAASLAWARSSLGADFEAHQVKTWNLSAIWRLDRAGQDPVWLKQVPHFFAHEPTVMRWLAAAGFGDLIPPVIAAEDGRTLMATAPGHDLFDATPATVARIAELYHPLQLATTGRTEELLALGVPDRRGPALTAIIEKTIGARIAADFPELLPLLHSLPERLAEVAACGLPDALVHGDLHSGNVRGELDGPYAIIDWGDSTIGNPVHDIVRLVGRLEPADAEPVIEAWARRWQRSVPGCEPRRALELIEPIVAVCNASAYALFLSEIEASEHPYHALDVDDWLAKAVAALG